ncbi:MAG: Abi family protein [Cellulomonadaceae bacterium]|jgi:hypothetical protein|nr:Abi family protein [Cellulomonadaceae bacterium]
MQPTTSSALELAISTPRFQTYLEAASDDRPSALQLYLWNTRLAAAFLECISIFEVFLRNAIDVQLRRWNVQQVRPDGTPLTEEWLLEAGKPLNSHTASARRVATEHATKARSAREPFHPRKTAPITHDDVLAQLSLGTITRLLPTANVDDPSYKKRCVLWAQAVSHAFPHDAGDSDGSVLAARIHRVHRLRNRVAHAEPLLGVNVQARHRDMIRVIGTINPELQGWFASLSDLRDIAANRPVG